MNDVTFDHTLYTGADPKSFGEGRGAPRKFQRERVLKKTRSSTQEQIQKILVGRG